MSMEYDGFVYQWINVKTGKKYIGSHFGREDDKYIGSRLHFRRAYRLTPSDFTREILEYVKGDRKTLLEKEQLHLLSVTDIANNDEYYNLSSSAGGERNHAHLDDDYRREIIEKAISASLEARRTMSDEVREKLRKKKQDAWKRNTAVRNRHSENTRRRRFLEEQTRTVEQKESFKAKCAEVYHSRNEKEIAQHHLAQSKGVTLWHQTKDPKIEKQRIDNIKKTKKAKALRYIHRTDIKQVKLVPSLELEQWLNNGWTLGRGKIK